jgi:hypothetical protein
MIIVDENFLTPEEIVELKENMVEKKSFPIRFQFDSDSQEKNELSDSIWIASGDNFDGTPQLCCIGKQFDYTENKEFDDYAKKLLSKFAIKHHIPVQEVFRTKSTLTFPKPDPRPDYAHVDYGVPGYVLLIYVVDSDGDTVLYNEKYDENNPIPVNQMNLTERMRVTPKAGKAVLFDNYIFHAVYNPVNSKFRQIINMNFTAPDFNKDN